MNDQHSSVFILYWNYTTDALSFLNKFTSFDVHFVVACPCSFGWFWLKILNCSACHLWLSFIEDIEKRYFNSDLERTKHSVWFSEFFGIIDNLAVHATSMRACCLKIDWFRRLVLVLLYKFVLCSDRSFLFWWAIRKLSKIWALLVQNKDCVVCYQNTKSMRLSEVGFGKLMDVMDECHVCRRFKLEREKMSTTTMSKVAIVLFCLPISKKRNKPCIKCCGETLDRLELATPSEFHCFTKSK